jgi:hypothetical protein
MTLPDIRRYITPPNPIIHKILLREPSLPPTKTPKLDSNSDEDPEPPGQLYTLFTAYYQQNLIFIKWKQRTTTRNGLSFYASHFFDKYDSDKFKYEGHIVDDTLVFNSTSKELTCWQYTK